MMKSIRLKTHEVQNIFAGKQTQARQICSPVVKKNASYISIIKGQLCWNNKPCPYGKIGDILWVRETWGIGEKSGYYFYKANTNYPDTICKWKPSIHMPREACRLFLKIKSMGVERLQDISEEDAIAEGVEALYTTPITYKHYNPTGVWARKDLRNAIPFTTNPVDSFRTLWQSRYGVESWEDNIWVWVLKFSVLNKDEIKNLKNDN